MNADRSVKVHQLLRDCYGLFYNRNHAHRCWSERASTLTTNLEAGQVPKIWIEKRMVQLEPSVMPIEITEWRFFACEDHGKLMDLFTGALTIVW